MPTMSIEVHLWRIFQFVSVIAKEEKLNVLEIYSKILVFINLAGREKHEKYQRACFVAAQDRQAHFSDKHTM